MSWVPIYAGICNRTTAPSEGQMRQNRSDCSKRPGRLYRVFAAHLERDRRVATIGCVIFKLEIEIKIYINLKLISLSWLPAVE
jgi:hypothetical protein